MTLEERLSRFPLRNSGGISYREAGRGQALVCLHGIGATSGSWLYQLEKLSDRYRVIAWDAPGYEGSAPLKEEKPAPAAYAQALHGLVDRLLLKDIIIVANSLGGLFAGAYARAYGERVRSMFLISPTGGFGGTDEAFRKEKREGRFNMLKEIGFDGMAEKRSPTLFGKKITPETLELARWTQRRLNPAGYIQAVWCLDVGKHVEDAPHFQKRVQVVCGTLDTVTPEAGVKKVAAAYPKGSYEPLADLGHIAHIEDAALLNRMISEFAGG